MFGGDNIDTICKYDISDNTWAVLNCKLESALECLNSIPISPTEILLFGGRDINYKNSQDSYIFNSDTNSISESIKMPHKSSLNLLVGGPARIGETIYAQFDKSN